MSTNFLRFLLFKTHHQHMTRNSSKIFPSMHNFNLNSMVLFSLVYYLMLIVVVNGRMESVEENEKSQNSIIHVSVENVYRQIENHFTQKSDDSAGRHNHSSVYHRQDSSSNVVPQRRYADTIIVPKKCGVRRGEGLFLFLGKLRLGKAILQCAPRLEEFTKMWHRALDRKSNPCTMKWNL